ncbi:MAG: Gfo/Idh/MocA family oxidoreductase [Candidatus Marinimicrobia bacterium]|nr:Gfo/Idh/MocA family oxidoreductase [Candidatus Neomarinimicrobiota bacterium]
MSKIRLGIVGSGIVVKEFHYPALKELTDLFEITAVTSRTKKNAVALAKTVGTAQVFDNMEEMLKSGLVDAVDLALPVNLNYEFIKNAIKYNVHVICEKPVAHNLEYGEKIVELSQKTDKVIYIAENYRHFKSFHKAKELIKQDKIGNPLHLSWIIFNGLDINNPYAKTAWRKMPKHLGGFISDGGVHNVASMRLILGEIKNVKAITKNISGYLGGYDFITSVFEFESGATGHYTVFYSLNSEEEFLIFGDRGTLKIGYDYLQFNDDLIKFPEETFENSFNYEFIDFYKIVTGQKPNDLGSPMEALKDLEFFEKALSGKNKQEREQ